MSYFNCSIPIGTGAHGSLRSRAQLLNCKKTTTASSSRLDVTAKAAAAQIPRHDELLQAARELAELSQARAPQEEIENKTNQLATSSAAAAQNTVFQDINDGSFRGYTLSGQTAARFSSVITLGVLSFNSYQPTNLKIKIMGADSAGVYKGPRGQYQQAYVIATPFEVVETGSQPEHSAVASSASDAAADTDKATAADVRYTGIKGRSLAVGQYRLAADNPGRLIISFNKMVLEPDAKEGPELQQWLDTFLPHNPTMDTASGVLEVDLPVKSPEGWMDYLMMLPEYQLVKGNFGSITLLERVA